MQTHSTVFRTSVVEESTTEPLPPVKPVTNVVGVETEALTEDPETSHEHPLDAWETANGKYGHEYFGIKNIANEFPLRADFSTVDKYLKETMDEMGYDRTPERWQNLLNEIEDEIGSRNLNAIDRVKRLANYIKVIKKMKALKAKQQLYQV